MFPILYYNDGRMLIRQSYLSGFGIFMPCMVAANVGHTFRYSVSGSSLHTETVPTLDVEVGQGRLFTDLRQAAGSDFVQFLAKWAREAGWMVRLLMHDDLSGTNGLGWGHRPPTYCTDSQSRPVICVEPAPGRDQWIWSATNDSDPVATFNGIRYVWMINAPEIGGISVRKVNYHFSRTNPGAVPEEVKALDIRRQGQLIDSTVSFDGTFSGANAVNMATAIYANTGLVARCALRITTSHPNGAYISDSTSAVTRLLNIENNAVMIGCSGNVHATGSPPAKTERGPVADGCVLADNQFSV